MQNDNSPLSPERDERPQRFFAEFILSGMGLLRFARNDKSEGLRMTRNGGFRMTGGSEGFGACELVLLPAHGLLPLTPSRQSW